MLVINSNTKLFIFGYILDIFVGSESLVNFPSAQPKQPHFIWTESKCAGCTSIAILWNFCNYAVLEKLLEEFQFWSEWMLVHENRQVFNVLLFQAIWFEPNGFLIRYKCCFDWLDDYSNKIHFKDEHRKTRNQFFFDFF